MPKNNRHWCNRFSCSALAITGALYSITPAWSYHQLTVFGDSLSDTGNRGRYTFDNDKNAIYDEILAQRIGVTLKPSNNNGFNYAIGGAVASADLRTDNNNTQDQLDRYLNRMQGHADGNSLYIHWIGANDLIRIINRPALQPQEQEAMVTKSAQQAVGQIRKLVQSGAQTIIVPTVPDIGLTPLLLERVIQAALPSAVKAAAIQAAYKILNNASTPDATLRQDVIHQAIAAAIAQTGTSVTQQQATTAQLITSYNTLSTRAGQLAAIYNQQEDQLLAQSGGNIVRADVGQLFTELLAKPNQYGLANTVGVSCPMNVYADKCTSDMAGFDNNQAHLFADNIHSTPQVHIIIADYLQSVLDGPVQVTALNQAATTMARDVRSTLDSRLQQLRSTPPVSGSWSMFGGYAGQHGYPAAPVSDHGQFTTHNLTLGTDYQLTENWSVGSLISGSRNKQHPSSRYEYRNHGVLFSLFSAVNIMENGFLSADLHLLRMDYDNIKRHMTLGPITRTENGDTRGHQWGARLTAGWDIPVTPHISTGPMIQYTLDYSKTHGYSENMDDSTAMRFSDQTYHAQIAGFGWRLDSHFAAIKPYLHVDWQHQFGDDVWQAGGSLKSSQTSFVRTSARQDPDWVNFTLGTSMPLGTRAAVFATVSQTAGLSTGERFMYNLGGSLSF